MQRTTVYLARPGSPPRLVARSSRSVTATFMANIATESRFCRRLAQSSNGSHFLCVFRFSWE